MVNALIILMNSTSSWTTLDVARVPLNLRAYPSSSTHFDSSLAYNSMLGLHSGDGYVSSIFSHSSNSFLVGILPWKKDATLKISRDIVKSSKTIAWSRYVGCVVRKFSRSFRTTSFSPIFMGQRRHRFISGKYSA
jgi:hypothetical protein